jgi:hypothetical protein
MRDHDFEYFIQNIEAFYRQYGHKFLVIKNRNILGVYDSFDAALDETLRVHNYLYQKRQRQGRASGYWTARGV